VASTVRTSRINSQVLGSLGHVTSLGCFALVTSLGCFALVTSLGCFALVTSLGSFSQFGPHGSLVPGMHQAGIQQLVLAGSVESGSSHLFQA
jgi:hypothetical protein